jgi:putative oxidoreductase
MLPVLRSVFSGRHPQYGALVLRVLVGTHLVQGTQDNVFSWARMVEFSHFLAAEGFPVPLACAVVSVSAQFACGLLYVVGFLTRWVALVMLFNFSVALWVHLGDPYPAWFPALVMWAGSLALLFTGAGAWSIDAARARRRSSDPYSTPSSIAS